MTNKYMLETQGDSNTRYRKFRVLDYKIEKREKKGLSDHLQSMGTRGRTRSVWFGFRKDDLNHKHGNRVQGSPRIDEPL